MRKYDVFLFDADGTLYDFDKAEANALKTMFEFCGFRYSDETLAEYRDINTRIWDSYEKGEISKDDLQTLRFSRLFDTIGIQHDETDFNNKYLAELGKGAFLIDGAFDICQAIVSCGKTIYIVSNGILATQEARIKHSLIKDCITGFFVSEFVGYKKPDVEYFEYVFSHTPQVGKDRILLVGDSLLADIAGGNDVGIDTCWLNMDRSENHTGIVPTYEIRSLHDLISLI